MAERELKIKVAVDTDGAERAIESLNQKLDQMRNAAGRSTKLGAVKGGGASGGGGTPSTGSIAGGAAIGGVIGNLATSIAKAVYQNSIVAQNISGAIGSLGDSLLQSASQSLGLRDESGVNQFSARRGAVDRAAGDVAGLLGSAPDVGGDTISKLLASYARVHEPGQRNLQRLDLMRSRMDALHALDQIGLGPSNPSDGAKLLASALGASR